MASGVGVFKQYQPEYEARGIATFPCTPEKVPAISHYDRLGKPGSRKLAAKSDANAFGFMVGKRLTIVDVDTPDENTLADALTKYGRTPLVVRSGSGNHQLWYRHNGEGRQIRPDPQKPIDILGGGYVVAPPSKVKAGSYGIIQGSLDDIDRLPTILESANVEKNVGNVLGNVGEGRRNKELFKHLLRNAPHCDTFADLLDVAQGANENFLPPLPDAEVVRTAQSAWGIEQRGQNRVGKTGTWSPTDEVNRLVIGDPDGFLLLSFLRANNGPRSRFMIANEGLSEKLGWTRKRLAGARSRLVASGYFNCVRYASANVPALYQWGAGSDASAGAVAPKTRIGEVLVEDRWSNLTTPTPVPDNSVAMGKWSRVGSSIVANIINLKERNVGK